ncbi:MAG: hypothetical protein ACFB0D_13365 [Phormidesmis sp.]
MNNSYQSLCDVFRGDRRTNLTAALMKQHRWPQGKASKAVDEYVMFLYVASLNAGVHLVPTQEIDCVWEADILQSTAQYMQTCQTLCGRVIHHAHVAELKQAHASTDTESIDTEAAFATTQTLFGQYFGETRLSRGLLPAAACGVL